MPTDPRLNLISPALVNASPIAPIGSGSNPSSSSVNAQFIASVSSNISNTIFSQSGLSTTGSFENLQLGQGGGSVGAGLTSLASLSNNIRVNGPVTASNTFGLPVGSTDPNAGISFILQAIGLNLANLAAISKVNAAVSTLAQTTASSVYSQVENGTFINEMIPSVFSAFQNAITVYASISQSSNTVSYNQSSNFGTLTGASPYAIDLISFAPKYKFLFVVQFEFNSQFSEVMKSIDPAFVVKTSSRPNVEFEYQDVNMYNFRTKVPTKTVYQPVTMKFYDDDKNNAFQFYTTYLKLMSPIANIDIESQAIDPLDAYDNVGGGMGFSQNSQTIQPGWTQTKGQGYAASLGPYGEIPTGGSSGSASTNVRNVLRRITLFQVYRQGLLMNIYHFYNPKITSVMLDDMEMATTGEGNEVSLTFSYDSVFIIPGYNINLGGSSGTSYNLPGMTSDGIYPFGINPGSLPVSLTSTLKDGVGAGISDGQSNMMTNASAGPTSSNFITTPNSVSNFDSTNPTTISGTSLANLASTPTIVGGGSDTSSTIQGNTSTDLDQTTTTQQILPDPTTGATQNSADNSGDVENAAAQTTQNNSSAVNAAAANVNSTQDAYNAANDNFNTAYAAYTANPTPENQAAALAASAARVSAQTAYVNASNTLTAAQDAASSSGTVPSTTSTNSNPVPSGS